ncbi:MAG: hypothetical protein QM744_15285 [Mesorhizobium sp.]
MNCYVLGAFGHSRCGHAFEGNRAWFRFAFKWKDAKTGKAPSRAGMQSYRVESGKLIETWLSMQPLGSSWSDATAQEHSTADQVAGA